MCLGRVDRIYKGTSRKIEARYKAFFQFREGNPLHPLYISITKDLPEGVWLDERDYREDDFQDKEIIESSDGKRYSIGWHVLLTEEDVRSLMYYYPLSSRVVRKVLCKWLLAKGTEYNRMAEVYRYIKIEKEV